MEKKKSSSIHEETAAHMIRNDKGKFVHLTEDETGDDLVDVKVHNPLKKIYSLLEDIKSHQEIPFNLKFSLPLIALPIVLAASLGFGGFQLGRLMPFCQKQFTTHIGQLYALDVVDTSKSQLFWEKILFLPNPSPIPRKQVVLKDQEKTLVIFMKFNADLLAWHNQWVAATGDYYPCTQTLILMAPENLTLLSH